MRQRGTSWVLAALLGGVLATTACGSGGGQTAQESPKLTPSLRIVKPGTLDAGVFYFPVTGDDYRASLSAFLKAHPDLRCRYFGADDRTVYPDSRFQDSHIIGHTLVCTDPATNAQEETVP